MATLTIPAITEKAEAKIYSVLSDDGTPDEPILVDTIQGPFQIVQNDTYIEDSSRFHAVTFADNNGLKDIIEALLEVVPSYTTYSVTFQDNDDDIDKVYSGEMDVIGDMDATAAGRKASITASNAENEDYPGEVASGDFIPYLSQNISGSELMKESYGPHYIIDFEFAAPNASLTVVAPAFADTLQILDSGNIEDGGIFVEKIIDESLQEQFGLHEGTAIVTSYSQLEIGELNAE